MIKIFVYFDCIYTVVHYTNLDSVSCVDFLQVHERTNYCRTEKNFRMHTDSTSTECFRWNKAYQGYNHGCNVIL